jgi:hypothetical protein
MSNYNYIPSDIHIWKDKYETDKVATIKECMSEPPFCYNPQDGIDKLVFIQPNEAFQKLSDNLEKYSKQFAGTKVDFYDTNIRFKFNKVLRITRNIRIIIPQGMLTISIKDDGIELENIAIEERYQGKKWGIFLMSVFFDLLVDTFGMDFPSIHLDCIGCATLGPQYIVNDVSKQCKFFRKFGFRVTNYHKTGKGIKIVGNMVQRTSDHAEMKLDFSKWYSDFYSKNLVESEESSTFVSHI